MDAGYLNASKYKLRLMSALCGLAISATALVSSPARAQSEEAVSGARAAATAGAAAFNDGRWQDALDMFSRAESLVHAPPHLLFMARANEKLGKLVTAREIYNKVIRETLPATAPEAFRNAQSVARDEIEAIEPRLAKLTVKVEGGDGKKFSVTIDGRDIPAALVGVPVPADPGARKVEAKGEGLLTAVQQVQLAEGGSGSVTLKLAADPNYVAPIAAPEPDSEPAATPPGTSSGGPQDQGPQEKGADLTVPAYVALGVGVVGVGAGVLFTLQSSSKNSEADEKLAQCEQNGNADFGTPVCLKSDPLTGEIDSLVDGAKSAKTLAIVGYVVGGVGIATGVTLLALNGSSKGEAASVQPKAQLWVGLQSVGVSGTW
jgi:hypothetical protein